jgi:hypothetical protein
MATPGERQSYALFEPKEDSCDDFIEWEVRGKILLGRMPANIAVEPTVSFK